MEQKGFRGNAARLTRPVNLQTVASDFAALPLLCTVLLVRAVQYPEMGNICVNNINMGGHGFGREWESVRQPTF